MIKFRQRHGSRDDAARPAHGFLARLRSDERGATLAMIAAAMIPLIGMVGGAVDFSRAYLVKTRLQQACDAGALAARRVMTDSTLSDEARTQADNFFNINLTDNAYGLEDRTFEVADVLDDGEPTGTVRGTASATVPTSLLKIFGKDEFVLNVSCDATLQISNNDIIFVLDVTGSMNCPAGVAGGCGGVEQTDSKMSGLRTAVVDFYDVLAAATTAEARLRIGFVPYSSNVNVGGLLPSDYIADTWSYQSRWRKLLSYQSPTTSNGSWSTISWGPWSAYTQHSRETNRTSAQCTTPANTSTNSTQTNTGNPNVNPDTEVRSTVITNTRTTVATEYKRTWTETTAATRRDPAKGTCLIEKRTRTGTETRTDTKTEQPNFTWRYEQKEYDTSQFKLGNAVTTRTGDGYTDVSSTWGGCIEERRTIADASVSSISDATFEADIDLEPNDDVATQWGPLWPAVVFDRGGLAAAESTANAAQTAGTTYFHPAARPADGWVACPKASSRLAVMDRDAVSGYVNAADFVPIGGTYHDVGLIWGGRLLSGSGIFSADNATAPNGKPINRHIVFMTDGDMAPNARWSYTMYGYEYLDRKISGIAITPSDSDLKTRHNTRFSAICEAIKDKNITIWVVAYSQAMTDELEGCATPGKSFYAANPAELKRQFELIASQIAELRLSR